MTQFINTSLIFWIIIAFSISIKWCYISTLLVIGSSTEPSLFHVGCRPSLHVGLHLLQHLYLTMGGTHPASMSKRPTQHLYLTMGRTHPTSMSERHAQHSHLTMGGPSCHHVRKAQRLHLTMGGPACHHVKKAQHLHPSAW